jgi:5S rRNA maturation endonuclease (ribonuclease M5)
MLAGQKMKVGVLLDADREGKKVRDNITKNRIIRENHVIFIKERNLELGLNMYSLSSC